MVRYDGSRYSAQEGILFEAITARDYPIIQAFTVVVSVGYVMINLIVDLAYAYLDPRIRLT